MEKTRGRNRDRAKRYFVELNEEDAVERMKGMQHAVVRLFCTDAKFSINLLLRNVSEVPGRQEEAPAITTKIEWKRFRNIIDPGLIVTFRDRGTTADFRLIRMAGDEILGGDGPMVEGINKSVQSN